MIRMPHRTGRAGSKRSWVHIACHQRAVIGPDGHAPVFPVLRGQLSKQDPLFAGKVRLDFLWSLVFETK
jgi:hypothetical protein